MGQDHDWDAPLPPDQEVARQFLRIDRLRRTMMSRGVLHAADMRLLWLLTSGPPLTLREIAETLSLEQSTVNRQVNAAIRAGLVERFSQPGQSARVVAPSEEGRRRFAADIRRSLEMYTAGMAALGDEADTFVRLMCQFTEAYGEAVAGTGVDVARRA